MSAIKPDKGQFRGSCCRWATRAEQSRNTRRTIQVDGVCLKDICEHRGLSYDAVQARLRRGDPISVALSPLKGHAYRAMLAASPTPPEGCSEKADPASVAPVLAYLVATGQATAKQREELLALLEPRGR